MDRLRRVIYVTQDVNIHGGIEEVTRLFMRAVPQALFHFSISGRSSSLRYRLYYLRAYIVFLFKIIIYRPTVAHINIGYYPDFVRNLPNIMMARLFGMRVIMQSHFTPDWRFSRMRPLLRRLARYAVRKADLVVHLSPALEREFRIEFPSKATIVLPNAVGDGWLSHQPRPHKTRDNSIVFLGRYVADKGIEELVEAAARHVEEDGSVIYEFHGDGPRPAVYHDRIRLLPWIKGEAKRELLSKAKLLVLPSWREAFAVSLLEAMACGTPIVATRVGGTPDVVRDGIDGLLVDVKSPDQLHSAIRELLSNHSKWQAASDAARRRAEGFSEGRVIALWKNLYMQLARGARIRWPYLERVAAAYRYRSQHTGSAFESH